MSPLDFAYEHLGRHIAPGTDRLRWTAGFGLTANKKRARFGAGASVVITARGGLFAGTHPEAMGPGVPIQVSPLRSTDLLYRYLLEPPAEPWIGIAWGKASVTAAGLILNLSPEETVVSLNSGQKVIRARPRVLAEAAAMLSPLPERSWYQIWHIWHAQRRGAVVPAKAATTYAAALDQCPQFTRAFTLLACHEQPLSLLSRYHAARVPAPQRSRAKPKTQPAPAELEELAV